MDFISVGVGLESIFTWRKADSEPNSSGLTNICISLRLNRLNESRGLECIYLKKSTIRE